MPGGRGLRRIAALGSLALLAACGRIIPPAAPPPTPPSAVVAPAPSLANAVQAGVSAGPAIASLGLDPARAALALASFRESCPRLLGRSDASGLTRAEDWRPACAAAPGWNPAEAPRFFATWFEAVRVGDGRAFATGYYEPEIAGVRQRRPGFDVPVHAVPPDLVQARPGDAPPTDRGTQPFGRYNADGRFENHFDRGAIEDGALAGKGLEIAWVADPVELFFLQVQGSGRLRASDGSVMRIGYAGRNGHPYTGIGKLLNQRGLIGSGPGQYPGSMQGLKRYLRENPEAGRALMRENRSYVFFRELTGDGPLGTLGVPVRARASAAADPAFVPLGAPVWLALDRAEANGVWIAQDTGGAIRGANRFDTFWGAGEEAAVIAGGMAARGQALVLLPQGTLARLKAR
mgnify:CR=1 FL=1